MTTTNTAPLSEVALKPLTEGDHIADNRDRRRPKVMWCAHCDYTAILEPREADQQSWFIVVEGAVDIVANRKRANHQTREHHSATCHHHLTTETIHNFKPADTSFAVFAGTHKGRIQ